MDKDITRRRFLGAVGATTVSLTACSILKKQQHPNLVFVLADQWRGQALGFLNEDPVITPYLDDFAKESLVLPQAVSCYPVCSPYRAMLMTGTFPHHNKVYSNCNSNSAAYGVELQETDRCWSDVLKDSGYSLGYIGKWHLDAPHEPYVDCKNNRGKTKWNEWTPPNRRHGFDFWYAYGTYDWHQRPLYWSTDAKRSEHHYVDQWGPEHEADLAIQYIQNENKEYRDPDQPFALVVSINPPHTPYSEVPQEYVDMYSNKSDEELLVRPNVDISGETDMSNHALKWTRYYFGMITGVDKQFGRIVKAIDQAGLEKDTIVVFTSDHGNCVGTHGHATKNNHYEESMRVPLLIRWTGKIKPRQDDLLFINTDFYPTLLDVMGFSNQIPANVQGQSHANLFVTGEGKRPDFQPYMWMPIGQPQFGRRGVRTYRHKLEVTIMPDQPKKVVLHDLKNDPYELKNIADEQPEVVEGLIASKLQPWLESVGDEFEII